MEKFCYISKEIFEDKHTKDKNYRKVRDHYHYTGELEWLRIAYVI